MPANPPVNNSHQPGGSLLEGAFDEGESHNGFLEALKAFRGEKSTPAADDAAKSVRFQDGDKDKPAAGKKGFFANLNTEDFDVNCLPEPPTFSEGGTKTDAQGPELGPKDSCW